MTCVAFPG